MATQTTTWVLKLSKLCNMRCSYCYEWNELGSPARMPIATWRKVLSAIAEHSRLRLARTGASSTASGDSKPLNVIVLHGGEPFALPTAYLREVLECYDELRSRDTTARYGLHVQSNLLSVSDEKLDLLLKRKACLSFSCDVRPGVRLNVAGQATEATVAANADRLAARGIPLSGIAVLAKHTVDHVREVYDFYARRGMAMRILPLFDGPAERPQEHFKVDHARIVQALEALFRHWMSTGCKVPIYPFVSQFEATLRAMLGISVHTWSRAERGDAVLMVNVDGRVFRVLDAYEQGKELGNLTYQSMGELLRSQDTS